MEGRWRTVLVTAIAPVSWGSTYFVTRHHLPVDRPLFGACLRALPVGLVLLALTRHRPHGAWWWRAPLLGTLSIGGFFALIYVAGQRLPTGLAATLTAVSPLLMMLLAWPLAGERPHRRGVLGALAGVVGVALLVLRADVAVDATGVAASLAAVTLASLGFVLTRRWPPPVPLLAFTSWQLVSGGLVLLPLALLVEGPPPALDPDAALGFLYLGTVCTGVAYAAWFHGLRRLDAGAVGLIGLLNPVAGVALGVLLAGETVGPAQLAGTLLVLAGIAGGQRITRAHPDRRLRPAGRTAAEGMLDGSAPPSGSSPGGCRFPSCARDDQSPREDLLAEGDRVLDV